MPQLIQPSFTGGELAPALYGRVDLARYLVSLRKALNFIVRPTGGVDNRAGTQLVSATANAAKKSVLIPFIFSTSQAYMCEFAEGVINVYYNGGPAGFVANITNAIGQLIGVGPTSLRVKFTTDVAHGFVGGEAIAIQGLVGTGSFAGLNGNWTVFETVDATNFRIVYVWDTGGYVSGGQIFRFPVIASPYLEADLPYLRYTQSADVLTVTHQLRTIPPYELKRQSAFAFTFTAPSFDTGPFRPLNADPSILVYASAGAGKVTLTATSAIFEAGHIGGLFRLEERRLRDVKEWEASKQLVGAATSPINLLRRSDGKVYRCVTDTTAATAIYTGSIRPIHEVGVEMDGDGNSIPTAEIAGVAWEYLHSQYGILRITAVASPTSATATVTGRLPDSVVGGAVVVATYGPFTGDGVTTAFSVAGATSNDPNAYEVTFDGVQQRSNIIASVTGTTTDLITFAGPPLTGVSITVKQLSANNRTDIWAFGAWSTKYGFPGEAEYYQDRLGFANTLQDPQTRWFSKTSDYHNFSVSTPSVDDDAITDNVNARQVNAILDMVPLATLMLLTGGAEWRTRAGVSEVLTQTTIGAKPQSYNGSNGLAALLVGNIALYVQRLGRLIYDMVYDYTSDSFNGNDLTVTSFHLVENRTVISWAYQKNPYSAVWLVMNDGTLLSMTYMREQQVIGWSPHATDGFVEWVAVIPEATQDAVYLIVRRTINGATARYIERLAVREVSDARDLFFVDCGLTYDGRNTLSKTMTLTGGVLWDATETLTLTASGTTFVLTDIGNAIQLIDATTRLDLEITAYTSGTVVSVRASKSVPADLRAVATTNWAFAKKTMSGLSHLEGKTLATLADGNVVSGLVVTAGAITLPSPAAVVHAGLPYIADFETLDVTIPGAEAVMGRSKNVPMVNVLVKDARGLWLGNPDGTFYEKETRLVSDQYDLPQALTEVRECQAINTWDNSGRIKLRQPDPLPLTILAVVPDVKVGE